MEEDLVGHCDSRSHEEGTMGRKCAIDLHGGEYKK